MADWNVPINTSTYDQVLAMLKSVSVDAGTLFLAAPTNQPTGSMRWNRTLNQFEEWNGTTWAPKVLSVAGGGTGASTPSAARTALGLGTMSVQNADNVAITGGSWANPIFTGYTTISGGAVINATVTGLTINGVAGTWGAHILAGTAPSYGLLIQAGTGSATEVPFHVQNRAGSANGMYINGVMTCVIPTRLVIPVGVNLWA